MTTSGTNSIDFIYKYDWWDSAGNFDFIKGINITYPLDEINTTYPLNDINLEEDNKIMINVKDTEKGKVIYALAAGVKKSDIEIVFNGIDKKLTISWNTKGMEKDVRKMLGFKKNETIKTEVLSIDPEKYDVDKIETSLDNGILYIFIPYKSEAIKKIAIK